MSEDKPASPRVKQARKSPKKITQKYLYNAGLAYLERFPASSQHFRRVMGQKIKRSCYAHPEQQESECTALLEEVVAQFLKAGHLDDALYLRGMVNSLRGRGLSSMAIIMRLRQKGLDEHGIRNELARYDAEEGNEDGDKVAALKLARRKKIGPFCQKETDEALYKKWLGTFARAGYPYELAQTILSMPKSEAEERLS